MNGYQSDSGTNPIINTERQQELTSVSSSLAFVAGRTRYSVLNENWVTPKEIQVKSASSSFPHTFNVHLANFPKPNVVTSNQYTVLQSSSGNQFYLILDYLGKTYLSGTFEDARDVLVVDFTPYLAQYPLVFDPSIPS